MKRKVSISPVHEPVHESQEIKIIYPDILVSEEAKAAFSVAYKDLQTAYNNLKSNLDKYLSTQKQTHN